MGTVSFCQNWNYFFDKPHFESYYGGWVAPNIYYLGAAGCVEVGGITIAGISGIYKSHDYRQGRLSSMATSLKLI